MLDSLLREVEVEQALVFTATKRSAAELTLSLVMQGLHRRRAARRHAPEASAPAR